MRDGQKVGLGKAHQFHGAPVGRLSINVQHLAFLNHLALVKHHKLFGHGQRFKTVGRCVEKGGFEILLDCLQFIHQALAQFIIESYQRIVQ